MSQTHGLDRIADVIELKASTPDRYVEKYGHRAAEFLKELPWIFRLCRRAAFDLALPQECRHMCSLVVLYVAEHRDFLGDDIESEVGLIDDVWVAFRAVQYLGHHTSRATLAAHWKGPTPYDVMAGLAENLDYLAEHVPSKVLEAAQAYLGIVDAAGPA